MTERPSLFQRLKQARVVQVLVVYLGASWGVLQLADVLTNTAGLPRWVGALTLLLLAIGLVIILATAWVQSLPSTTAAEEAGERPSDWQIAPADVLASLKSGRLPHLTWGRAILGGVVALSLLFGGAGVYVLVTGGVAPRLGPTEVAAGEAATGIAVVPFNVTGGQDLALWREGMVDLLSTNLDGLGGFRTIDSRTVMARWHEKVRGDAPPDLRTVLEAAAATDARYGLVGALVGNPAGIRLSAEVYDLSTGKKVAEASEEGAAENVLDLTNRLSVALVRGLMGSSGSTLVQSERLDALTTSSLPALRAYLVGEAAMRRADFADAVAEYERAVGLDSLFALGWYRLSDAYGWLEDIGSPTGARAADRALSMLGRLPAREQILVRASEAARLGDASFFQTLRDAVQRYPDDPDIWYNFGDFIYHVALPVGLATRDQSAEAFDRAIALDPGFGPYQVHPIEFAIARGDRADAEARVARYEEATQKGDQRHITEYDIAIPLLLGDSAEAATAVQTSLGVDLGIVGRIRTELANRTDLNDRVTDLEWANRGRAGADHQWILYLLDTEGRIARADRLLDSLDLPASVKGIATGYALGTWTTAKDLPHRDVARPSTCEAPAVSGSCQMFVGWGLARSGDVAGAKVSARILRTHAGEARDSNAVRTIGMEADVVEGAIAAAEGRAADARRLLRLVVQTPGVPGSLARMSLAEVELAAGNTSEATTYLEGELGTYDGPHATLILARMHDKRGEIGEAKRYYRSFVTMTRRGDQDLPEIVEARAALQRLGG
jgi:tetratricopeptide (TPR) repeat protein